MQRSRFVGRVLEFFQQKLRPQDGFEDRAEQRAMAEAVARAIEDEEILVVEAGTGTGKSLAYLIPALLWARDQGGPVVISTRTLNLQQQLMDKDIPALQSLVADPFSAIPARGWSNYLCLRRLHSLPGSGQVDSTLEAEAARLAQQGVGLKQELQLSDGLWQHICCESTACNRMACSFYQDCYLFKERRKLERADLIITNHSLLMADLGLRMEGAPGILPRPTALVLDEGHHLEEVANEHLGRSFSSYGLSRLKSQLYQPKGGQGAEAGILPSLRNRLAQLNLEPDERRRVQTVLDRELLAALPDFYRCGDEFFDTLSSLFTGRKDTLGVRQTLTPDFPSTEVGEAVLKVASRLTAWMERVQQSMQTVVTALEPHESEQTLELRSLVGRLGAMRSDLEFCLFPDSGDWVYWAQESPQDCVLGATPLDVGDRLSRELFGPTRSVVVTSATLAVGSDLRFFEQRTGLDQVPDRLQRLCLDSPFDYGQQAYLGVATDLGEPGTPVFFDRCLEPLARLVRDLRGRTFFLLTSYTALRRAAELLTPMLAPYGIRILAQGDSSNAAMLDHFRRQGESILLGTDSFWEGVDVPGDALQCVVLGRLPFRVPTDPVVQAHCRRIEEDGGSSFSQFMLPQAVLRFRQGFGRLIRTSQDRGMVLVLDARLYHKPYGREFLDSLPRCTRRAGPWAGVVQDSLRWLRGGVASAAPNVAG